MNSSWLINFLDDIIAGNLLKEVNVKTTAAKQPDRCCFDTLFDSNVHIFLEKSW